MCSTQFMVRFLGQLISLMSPTKHTSSGVVFANLDETQAINRIELVS